ncbi:unnamed protein product [Pieris brassicae]|uniref:Uncharacterized protein n=1 Tax=Pieris brassicae TaxID=7116 RepID=A0A9P0WSZ5_PIEBR|nr:unnamed protein product [Pieris brassicae]
MFMKLFIVACLAVAVFECGIPPSSTTADLNQKGLLKDAFRRTCIQNDAEDKAPQTEAAIDTFLDCIKAQIDTDTLNNELYAIERDGAVHPEVIKKYCDKKPAFQSCIAGLFDGVYPCLSADVRGDLDSDKNATDHFLNYICHNHGERIILFMAEGEFRCFNEKKDVIATCMESHRKDVIEAGKDVKNMNINYFCNNFMLTTSCAMSALENCTSRTPSNVLESFSKYVKNSTPCKKSKQ